MHFGTCKTIEKESDVWRKVFCGAVEDFRCSFESRMLLDSVLIVIWRKFMNETTKICHKIEKNLRQLQTRKKFKF